MRGGAEKRATWAFRERATCPVCRLHAQVTADVSEEPQGARTVSESASIRELVPGPERTEGQPIRHWW